MWIFGYGSLVWKADFPYVKKIVGYIVGYERKFYQASIDHRGVPEKPGRVVTLIPSANPEDRVWGVVYKIHKRDVDFVVKHLDLREVMGYEKIPVEFYPTNHRLNIFDHDAHSTPVSKVTDKVPFTRLNTKSEETDSDSGRGSYKSDDSQSNGESSDAETDNLSSDEDESDAMYASVNEGKPFVVTMYFGAENNEHYVGPSSISNMAIQIFESSGVSGSNREYLFNLAESMREICAEALDDHLKDLEEAVRQLERSQTMARAPSAL